MKKPTAEQIEAAAWSAALATQVTPDKVPPGWNTSEEIAAAIGKSRKRTRELLRQAIAEGRCEKKAYRVKSGDIVCPVPHYKRK